MGYESLPGGLWDPKRGPLWDPILGVFTQAQGVTTTKTALAVFLKWSDWHSTVQMGQKGPAAPLIDIGLPRVPLMLSPTMR